MKQYSHEIYYSINNPNSFYSLKDMEIDPNSFSKSETFCNANEPAKPSSTFAPSPIEQFTLIALKSENKNKISANERVYVGDLREKWQFPSDHLPIGVQINDFRIITWNVLNNAYLDWIIEKDYQGLKGSMINDLNIEIQANGFTKRDQRIIEIIHAMMNSSAGIIALQECGPAFLMELKEQLPENWQIVKKSNEWAKNDEIILYNSTLFAYRSDLSKVSYPYPSFPDRILLNAVFERLDGSKQVIRILNAHIPGDPSLPGKEEFAQYIYAHSSSEETLVALGDHNFERSEMLAAYQKAGLASSEFDFHSPWHTNIHPNTKEAKSIDHIFVKGTSSRALKAEEIVENYHLKEIVELLSKNKNENIQIFSLENIKSD